ncbi:DMT family transporter [Solwaraspora sp. WMMD791]|uniref:DMT family transporter n=1 Tax=Solwaraspora sp. WMMD791 TaxID=3016086 RepID=UPI00249CA2BB|nr:DMT family transporter [Solwaraspora sp. WMMD791]WFE28615.1 DMT family transporter [Solwaraspora sp. WMMD791]
MTALLISVAFAVASAGAYALGAIAQERLAVRLGAQTPWRDILRALLRARRWWLSVALNAAGGGLHVAALAYGPLSVVQPLGVLTLVLALPIGAAVSAQRITRRQWGGATATVAGLVLLLVLTVPGSGDGMDAGDADTLVLTSAAVLVATIAGTILVRRPVPRSLMYATAAGVAFAIASALTHAVTREYADGGPSALFTPTVPAIAAMAVAGVLLSQLAYRGSGLGAPLATVTLANPVASAIIGVVLFEERFATGPVAMTLLVAAGATACAGILLLAPPAAPAAIPTEPVADDQPPRTPALCRR